MLRTSRNEENITSTVVSLTRLDDNHYTTEEVLKNVQLIFLFSLSLTNLKVHDSK